MLESMVAFNLVEHFYGLHFEPALAETGYPRLLNRFRKPFKTLDSYLCAMPYTDQHWKRFFIEAGKTDLALDPPFTNISARTRNIEALYEIADRIIAHGARSCSRRSLRSRSLITLQPRFRDCTQWSCWFSKARGYRRASRRRLRRFRPWSAW
jgi:hypothetical protein